MGSRRRKSCLIIKWKCSWKFPGKQQKINQSWYCWQEKLKTKINWRVVIIKSPPRIRCRNERNMNWVKVCLINKYVIAGKFTRKICQQTLTAENSRCLSPSSGKCARSERKKFSYFKNVHPEWHKWKKLLIQEYFVSFCSKLVLFFLVNPQSERRMMIGTANIFLFPFSSMPKDFPSLRNFSSSLRVNPAEFLIEKRRRFPHLLLQIHLLSSRQPAFILFPSGIRVCLTVCEVNNIDIETK